MKPIIENLFLMAEILDKNMVQIVPDRFGFVLSKITICGAGTNDELITDLDFSLGFSPV
jgi:hypothetical protein